MFVRRPPPWIAVGVLVSIVATAAVAAQEPSPAAEEIAREIAVDTGPTDTPETLAMRQNMLRAIEADMRDTAAYTGRSALDPAVLSALATVPRHEFVPEPFDPHAYDNRPLPIGEGQTISQPYIVALMTDLVEPASDHVVLDIGTGSGYQAAVLAELVHEVYSIEIVEPLGRAAAERLERLGYDNVHCRIGDGWAGWPEAGPFDAIVVAAAAPSVPAPLLAQLKPGGRMVIPLRTGPMGEELTLVEVSADGAVRQRAVLPVRFVPMTGGLGRDAPNPPDTQQ